MHQSKTVGASKISDPFVHKTEIYAKLPSSKVANAEEAAGRLEVQGPSFDETGCNDLFLSTQFSESTVASNKMHLPVHGSSVDTFEKSHG